MLRALGEYFERSRKPLAFCMVAIILVAGVLPSAPIQLAASILLLSIILNVLFELHGILTKKAAAWYPSFGDAVPELTREVREGVRAGRVVHLRWIGVTMEAAWPVVQNLLLECLKYERRMSISLAILDPDFVTVGSVKKRIAATIESVRRFIEIHEESMKSRGCELSLHAYQHRPTWHGLLIADQTLFFSTCLPLNFEFSSPQGSVEVIRMQDGPLAAERIEYFGAWADEVDKSNAIASI
jgi:hypothetical protein